MRTITEEQYHEAVADDQGYCTYCNEFTNDFVEPDAEGYECDVCGQSAVYGAEQALISGIYTFRQ